MSFVIFVCLCVRPPVSMEQFGPVDGFSLNWMHLFLEYMLKKFKFYPNLTKMGTLHKEIYTFMKIRR
jgi:hypothetical protein